MSLPQSGLRLHPHPVYRILGYMTKTEISVNRHGVQPGDIFYCSWGYDQTNVDFYVVTRVTTAKAEVLPIGSKLVGDGGWKVVANPDHVREYDVLIGVDRDDVVKSKLCTVKAGWGDRKATIVLRSGHYWAYPWDGDALYETDAMSGR